MTATSPTHGCVCECYYELPPPKGLLGPSGDMSFHVVHGAASAVPPPLNSPSPADPPPRRRMCDHCFAHCCGRPSSQAAGSAPRGSGPAPARPTSSAPAQQPAASGSGQPAPSRDPQVAPATAGSDQHPAKTAAGGGIGEPAQAAASTDQTPAKAAATEEAALAAAGEPIAAGGSGGAAQATPTAHQTTAKVAATEEAAQATPGEPAAGGSGGVAQAAASADETLAKAASTEACAAGEPAAAGGSGGAAQAAAGAEQNAAKEAAAAGADQTAAKAAAGGSGGGAQAAARADQTAAEAKPPAAIGAKSPPNGTETASPQPAATPGTPESIQISVDGGGRLPHEEGDDGPRNFHWIKKSSHKSDREKRKAAAQRTREICKAGGYKFGEELVRLNHVQSMLEGTHIVWKAEYPPPSTSAGATAATWHFAEMNSLLETAGRLAKEGFHVVAVNAASAYHAGGGFCTGGRHALEESICMRSTLFESLELAQSLAKEQEVPPPSRCDPPRREGSDWTCHIPETGCIVSPDVEVFRGCTDDGYPFYTADQVAKMTIISLAMPNRNAEVRDAPMDAPEGRKHDRP